MPVVELERELVAYHIGNLFGGLRRPDWIAASRASLDWKPRASGVLWLSPADAEYGWREWSQDERWYDGPRPVWWLGVRPGARLYVIDTLQDAADLQALFPGAHADAPLGSFLSVNWIRVASRFDGVQMTREGEAAGRWAKRWSTNGWDCESIAMFAPDKVSVIAREEYGYIPPERGSYE